MLKAFHFVSVFFQHFGLPSREYNSCIKRADWEPKFLWTASSERDSATEWEHFTSFLENHGVMLFGTMSYLAAPLPPSAHALSPFSPTRDEDFIYRPVPCKMKRKFHQHLVRALLLKS